MVGGGQLCTVTGPERSFLTGIFIHGAKYGKQYKGSDSKGCKVKWPGFKS